MILKPFRRGEGSAKMIFAVPSYKTGSGESREGVVTPGPVADIYKGVVVSTRRHGWCCGFHTFRAGVREGPPV